MTKNTKILEKEALEIKRLFIKNEMEMEEQRRFLFGNYITATECQKAKDRFFEFADKVIRKAAEELDSSMEKFIPEKKERKKLYKILGDLMVKKRV